MIRRSDDPAASTLWVRYGGDGMVSDVAARYGLTGTAPPRRRASGARRRRRRATSPGSSACCRWSPTRDDAAALLGWMRDGHPGGRRRLRPAVRAVRHRRRRGRRSSRAGCAASAASGTCTRSAVVGQRVVVLLSEVPRARGLRRGARRARRGRRRGAAAPAPLTAPRRSAGAVQPGGGPRPRRWWPGGRTRPARRPGRRRRRPAARKTRSAVSVACATSAEVMPAPSPRPRSRGSVATPTTSLTSVPSTSTGWCEPTATGSPFSTATIITVRPVGDPLAQDGRRAPWPPASCPAGTSADVRGAAGVGEGGRRDPLVARQLGVVGADDVEPDARRQQQLDRVDGDQQRQLLDGEPGGAGGRGASPASARAPTPAPRAGRTPAAARRRPGRRRR